jgi:ParB-like chromosome segregation protein Spo0J
MELAPTDTLRPNSKNSRTHSKKQIRQIASSIRSFGFLTPLIVDAGGTVLAGNGRLEAARIEGLTHVPVIRVDHLWRSAWPTTNNGTSRTARE